MKAINRTLIGLMVLATAPSAFAIKGKTMYHYIAYEAAFWPKKTPATAAEYPKVQLDKLVGLPFDTLVFAPMFGFGSMAANLKSASYPKHQPLTESRWMSGMCNAMPSLIKAGADPIALTAQWCRKNKREAVVALPVNLLGVHANKPDEKNQPNSWHCYLWPDFKNQNPDCLINPDGKSPCSYGSGNCVDYTNQKVRDKFASIACEIAGKYDIDGIMVDFTMTPTLFRSVAAGGVAAPKEVAMITEMMTKIKAACKAAGHPVALSARVPDSIGYCKDIGIDLQGWLDTKLLDYVVLGAQFQLDRCNAVGDIALKNGTPFYISMTHSGILVYNDTGYAGDDERLPRNHKDPCNARIADALLCKASGCMYTAEMHWDIGFRFASFCEPFDAKYNRTANKRYFVSYTNDRLAGNFLKDGSKYRVPQSLLSGSPVDLAKGVAKYKIDVWDDLTALARDDIHPVLILATEIVIPSGMDTDVMFNGKMMTCYKKRAGVQMYELDPKLVKKGENEVVIKSKGKNKRSESAKLGNIAVEVRFDKLSKERLEKDKAVFAKKNGKKKGGAK